MGKFILIAGPCVIESELVTIETAKQLQKIAEKYDIDFYFKSSFDKANRTSIDSFRGPGIDEGLRILNRVKNELGLRLVTDIHLPEQAVKAAKVVDVLQIPAFLCRQTDLLIAAACTGKVINIKKAQFLAPWDMKYVVKKIEEMGNNKIFLCERGTCFGYNTLVVDMTSLVEMKKFGYPVIYDATHSVQKPGGMGMSTGGNREYIKYLARAAAAVGINGMFAEVHPDPDNALSDGQNMIKLCEFENMLCEILEIYNLVNKMGT